MRELRTIAYATLAVITLILLYAQYRAFQTGQETITLLSLGYYNIPRDRFAVIVVSSMLMLLYLPVLTIGASLDARWLFPTQLMATITAILTIIAYGLYPREILTSLAILHTPLLYLYLEAIVAILEAFKYG